MNNHSHNNAIGICFGAVGGVTQYIANINPNMDFAVRMAEAAGTALLCGVAGMIGKEIYVFTRKWIAKKIFTKPKP